MSEEKPRLLLVEDERHLAAGLKLNFQLEGFAVDVAPTAREAGSFLLRPEAYTAILLDLMLPDLDGIELCRRLREAGNYTPIIMLTARSAAEDRVAGLEAGADDYIVKPFELNELLARVRSVMRRRHWDKAAKGASPGAILQFGDTRVNFDTQEISRAGRSVSLTRLELDLLGYFAQHPGRVISRGELLEQVWRLGNYPNTRTVDNFIVRLRRQFEPDPANPVFFVSVRGTGYKFIPNPSEP
jgi:DNA-binding response OmpR family regulator